MIILLLLCTLYIIAISIDANDAAEFEEAKQSPSSVEEERTPGGGGTKELVGHHYKIVHLNDAQLLVPDLAPIPPNMVAGCCQHGMDFMGRQGNSFEDHDDGREAT